MSTIGLFSATACLISIWQKGLLRTPELRKRMKAALSWMPFFIPSRVRSVALGKRAQEREQRVRSVMCRDKRWKRHLPVVIPGSEAHTIELQVELVSLVSARGLSMAMAGSVCRSDSTRAKRNS